MAANYLPYEPQQMMALPVTLQEWLPEGHLAHFISDAIDGLEPPRVSRRLVGLSHVIPTDSADCE